jgi:hypothetical protein
MFEPLEGGCLCGRVRYRVTMAPIDSGYCHCRMCQKSSGAPVQASAEVPIAGFAFIKGEARAYRSSALAVRHFCADCGSQLTFRLVDNPTYVSINTPTLDRPEALPPRMHIWRESRIPWFEAADSLPRYDREGPRVG